MYHSKKIGVFISHIFGYYQTNVCQGIIDKAMEYGYTTEIFTSLDGENLGSYAVGEDGILRIPNYDSLDGIIFAPETYLSSDLRQKILTHLQTKCTCPIIEIAAKDHNFPAVSLDNNQNARELTEHLIHTHHYKRICYLGCLSEPFYSIKREHLYRETMEENHMLPDSHSVYNSDYSKESASQALAFFCEEGTPEAVICYNDRLALLFLEAALSKNYRVPEDIAITGFDESSEGSNVSPMLSTVSFPVYELGVTAVENLFSMIRGEQVPAITTVTSKTIIRNSCGCKTCADNNPVFYSQKISRRVARLESSILESMNMSSTLHHVTDIDEGADLLEKYIKIIGNYREFYLCLYSDWDSISGRILELTNSQETQVSDDNMLLKFALKDGRRLPECIYQKKYPLPEYVYENSDCAYLYLPLFFGSKDYGYAAISFENNQLAFQFHLIQWQINMNQMLQNICEAKQAGLLVAKLEDIYMRDPLTGLFNKHGYNHHEELFLTRVTAEKCPVTAFMIDMNGLKGINDHFGHPEGDFAIQVLGKALESTTDEHTICARFSGDEFYVLSSDMDENGAEDLIQKIHTYLDNYNRLSNKEYSVSCSCGYACAVPGADFNSDHIQELFSLADKMMYVNKVRYHEKHRS